MGMQDWPEHHAWALTSSALAALVAYLKRRSISSTVSMRWPWLRSQVAVREELVSYQRREEICHAENRMLRDTLERLTGTALLLKEAKDQGLIRPLPDSSDSPTNSPTS